MKVTETEIDADNEVEDEPTRWDEAPIFGEIDRKKRRIEVVSVRRTDPPSGYLGTMPPDVSEANLQKKWGGGHYVLEGKNDTQLVAGARRTVKIAGEPVFTSELEEAEYRRGNRLPEKGGKGADGQLSTRDLMALMEERDEKRRTEQLAREERARAEVAERETRERKEREDRAALAARDAEERKERERKELEEREERRRREQRDDDERRARIHREDMERMQAGAAAQLAQTQQFFTQMATTLKADSTAAAKAPSNGGEMVKALLTGLQIAREIGGGSKDPAEPPDLLTSIVSRLPEVLQEVRETASAAYREMKGSPPGVAVAPPPRRLAPDELRLKGPTALKAKRVLMALKAQGKDPERELDQLLTMVGNSIGVPDDQAPAAPAAPPRPRPAAAAVVRTKQSRARPAVRTKQTARAAAPAAARRPRKARA